MERKSVDAGISVEVEHQHYDWSRHPFPVVAIVVWTEGVGQMRADVTEEDFDLLVHRVYRDRGIEDVNELLGFKGSGPLAAWELELLEGDSNPLPWIVLENGEPIAAFKTDWQAKDFIAEQVRNIAPGESFGLARKNVMTTYANKYKIAG